MTPIQAIIQKEAEARHSLEEREEEYGFKKGAEWMAEHMGKFAEFVEDRFALVKSKELNKSAWLDCKEHDVLFHGSDYHFTVLIQEHGITTKELIDIYFESINKEKQ